ncbi:NUDIX domain-containing protein [Silvimonas sp. JCM 19000]
MDIAAALAAWRSTQPGLDTSGLTRFAVLGHDLGWLQRETVEFLTAFDPAFLLTPQRLRLNVSDVATAEVLLQQAAQKLYDTGRMPGWRNELYDLHAPTADGTPDLQQPLLKLERAAFRRFGFTSMAVHINGYRDDGQIWIARRALSKHVDPDLLDNLAAGGIGSGERMAACAMRELWEEAGVPPDMAQHVVPVGQLQMQRNVPDGVHDEILYCYDLRLPDDFVPTNTDGEVAGFESLSADEVAARLGQMTWDAAAVTAAFLERRAALRAG